MSWHSGKTNAYERAAVRRVQACTMSQPSQNTTTTELLLLRTTHRRYRSSQGSFCKANQSPAYLHPRLPATTHSRSMSSGASGSC